MYNVVNCQNNDFILEKEIIMNIVSAETKLVILKKFKLFSQLLGSFSDSKKQMKYVKRMIYTECKTINNDQYLLSDADATEIDVLVNELKEISLRFTKVKNTDNYNRAKELLNRFNENLFQCLVFLQ